ncbi:C40 family peptidase [Bacillus sp. 1NLA3E]|uniref:C40 family peptidase n=1 Tax=Bacillus sp. 1NLA3E TaxID=666686 RepID=UPI000247E69D|nr:peptidoglycan hydrolase [Bacillus sp. 1NLA3E]
MKKKIVSAATLAILSTAFAGGVSANSYIVQKGDTLSHIALKYQTSISELKRLNSLSSDFILINQSLVVSQTNTSAAPIKPTVQTPTQSKTYTIVSGDTLSKIAVQHGISLSDLMTWNGLTTHLIYPGNVLKVSTPDITAGPAPTVPVQTASTSISTNSSSYTIKSGDTLSQIARQFGTTVTDLKLLNNLTSDLIYVGRTLKVTSAQTSNNGSTQTTVNTVAPITVTPVNNPSSSADSIVNAANAVLGAPYVWGGTTPAGFDCSGFVFYVYNQAGKPLSRLSAEGYYNRSYYVSTPEPGDLLFFENTYKTGISHMGIYLGGNQFIQADSDGVQITDLNNPYYKQHFDGYKRFY